MKQQFVSLLTERGEALTGQPWDCYPRPQLVRDSFINLNGVWDFALSPDERLPETYDRTILVPFPPQSALSGLGSHCPEGHWLFYRRTFPAPPLSEGGRLLLHVGGADQIARVYLNGTLLGEHRGGYHPFTFDVTRWLEGENTLIIAVTDHMSRGILPYGKQRAKRGGMWYTPVSGIWQTVWLEEVPARYIRRLRMETGRDRVRIRVEGEASEGSVTLRTPEGEQTFPLEQGEVTIRPEHPRLWSPEDPYLYRFTLRAGEDRVESYFALRTLTVEQVGEHPRLCLNGKPYFFHGVLDQGYWSDGLFTPAHPSCYEDDILAMKGLGFNTLRKHVKVEPEQFYYDCDRLGMVVFQDMVNNGDYCFIRDTGLPTLGWRRRDDRRMHRDPETRGAFLTAMEETVEQLANHPCLCYWTVFNEGWGQFESTAAYRRVKELDPSRFVAGVSGWFKGGESDVSTEHIYFKPFKPSAGERPLVLSEFGGYSYTVKGHAFHPGEEYGYRRYDSREDFVRGLTELYEMEVIPALEQGLCAAIYTQLSDVEEETNGLVTYDRRVAKVLPEEFLPISRRLTGGIEGEEALP